VNGLPKGVNIYTILFVKMSNQKIYLDYASTTPVDPAVFDAMKPYLAEQFGNPGSLHSFGQQASGAVFTARQMIAKELNCHYSEVVFTGSATEANNLAIGGAVRRYVRSKVRAETFNPAAKPRVIISAVEHESVLKTAQDLVQDIVDLVVIPVSKDGVVDLKKLQAALNEHTALVSIMYANNEVGTIQPIREIAELIHEFRGDKEWPLLHTDAVQAFQYLECDVQKLGVDLLTFSAHKIYGPKGIGALYVRSAMKGVNRLYPIDASVTGGGQEHGLRSGTENVAAIVGFSKAVSLAAMDREDECLRIAELRDQVWQGIKKIFPKAVMNGSLKERLPNNLNFYIPLGQSSGQAGVSGEQLLVALDLQGIAVSSGSACSARSIDPSYVLLAMGCDKARAKNSIRISLGRMTTTKEIAGFLAVLKKVSKGL
jgi:cysteine desulfurase